MSKIRLDLEALKVESFVTSEGSAMDGGTVFGMEPTQDPMHYTCNNCEWTMNHGSPECTYGGGNTSGGPDPFCGSTQDQDPYCTNDYCDTSGDTCGIDCEPAMD